jgi:two-component system sensor histidine kinase KdpD
MNQNPNPEKQVGNISPQKERLKQGRLKIFLGYATGVGKTFAMLDAARQRLGAGADVVAGYVETHGQGETEEALRGMEVMSRVRRTYHNVTLEEMDLDALLDRGPDLALVDDLAHTNMPGSRHARRYQDVLELLNDGIDVYTTLNVHHLESLNDVVAQITGVIVHETVPDHVLDEADEVEIIDLPVDELLLRVQEGRIPFPDDATSELFRPGNLTALRELALRRAADRIDEQMRVYMQRHGIAGPWPATERVLVCISPSPLSERLVRTGRRLATLLNADWHAVFVETPDQATLTEDARDRVARVLRLGDELGAKSVTVPSDSVAEAVTDYARTHNVTKIIAGKPLRPRWRELLRGSIVDQIIRDSRDVDVYVISGARDNVHVPTGASDFARRTAWTRFAQSAGLVAVATLLGLPLRFLIEPTNLVMFYLLAVIIAAIRLGRAPAIVASVLSVVAFDLVFVPPYYTFVVADAQYLLTFAALFGVGVVLSTLAARAREQARAAQRRAAQTAVLYDLSCDLAAAGKLEDVTRTVVSRAGKFLSSPTAVMVRRDGGLVVSGASSGYELDAGERAAAEWAFQHSSAAGRSTETMAGAEAFYLPLRTHEDVVGVLGVSLPDPAPDLSAEQRRLLESFASQGALAIERSLLAEEAKRVE